MNLSRWPSAYNFTQFKQFITKIGLPSLIVDLAVKKEVYIRRYKIKNEMDPEGETSEEDQQKIDDLLNAGNLIFIMLALIKLHIISH